MLSLLFIMLMICAQSLLGNSLIHTSFIGNKSIKCCFCCQGANTPQMRAGSTWRPLLWTYTAISFYPTPLTRPGAAPASGLITCTSAATRPPPPPLLLLLSRTGRKSGYVSVIQEVCASLLTPEPNRPPLPHQDLRLLIRQTGI